MSSIGARQAGGTALPKNSILSFFPLLNREGEPGVRRQLNTPVPLPRKRPMTAGRTNPLKSQPDAEGPNALRRLRPSSIAKTRLLKRPIVVAAPGIRLAREEPLTVDDLWRPGFGPPHVEGHHDDCCGLCLQLQSHPVFYSCGHGHCYTCARIWLEDNWTCPQCEAVVTQAPFRIQAVEALMKRVYGDWDTSVVSYEWDGITFPVVPIDAK
ncbi:hypothetical protein C8F04DRAFT_1274797 [Mycena alexandri]|uniref:RING-type domain-containing protein n=1 Tax=Mycena alexandri TaxID=1745969 RepID=A0AAD6WPR2_9AGAR|nr:hypothetical protein C8F04DRAFT_1274797 [Mycena alexandri]